MAKTKLKKGDEVVVIAGTDKGAKGKILAIDAEKGKVLVEGVHMIKKHQKQQGQTPAGIVTKEAPIHISNVMYLHEGVPTRLGIKTEVKENGGKKKIVKSRFAKKSDSAEIVD